MLQANKNFFRIYWLVTLLAFGASIALWFVYTPIEATMGATQRIFYVHLPTAICTFLACVVNFIACIGLLSQRKDWWDDLAEAAALVAVALCSVVLITGMIWGKKAWGAWWDWKSPRLVFSLVLWFLYLVYLIVRSAIESGQRRAVLSAVYGVIAFLDVPLVWLSVRLIPDSIHPPSVPMEHRMKVTMAVWFVPVTLLTIGWITARYLANARRRALSGQEELDSGAPGGFTLAKGEQS